MEICIRIRKQLFFYIDNELKNEKREKLVEHLNSCESCQNFFDKETELKAKICDKLKAAYVCKCDVEKLRTTIEMKLTQYKTNDPS